MRYKGLRLEVDSQGKMFSIVTVQGGRGKKIRLPVVPGHKDFARLYTAARNGVGERHINGPDHILGPHNRADVLPRIASRLLNKAQSRSKRFPEPSDLTREYIEDLIIQQDYRCLVSGSHFNLTPPEYDGRAIYGPSLDRIDCHLGYMRGNVRVVTLAVNMGRNNLPDADYFRVCEMVYKHNVCPGGFQDAE